MCRFAFTVLVASFAGIACAQLPQVTFEGVDYADSPGMVYTPLRPFAKEMGWPVVGSGKVLTVNGKIIDKPRSMFGGATLLSLQNLEAMGGKATFDKDAKMATVVFPKRTVQIRLGHKFVVVNKDEQELRAYQGQLLVMATHVSTGRPGHGTPSGDFKAHFKERMHLSRLYNEAQMPYAVNVNGNIFVHGFPSVPRRPASHGCVRMPLHGKNAAKWFYKWVSVGTPISIKEEWPDLSVTVIPNAQKVATGEPSAALRPQPAPIVASYRQPSPR